VRHTNLKPSGRKRSPGGTPPSSSRRPASGPAWHQIASVRSWQPFTHLYTVLEQLSLRAKLVGMAALGFAFALAVGIVGLAGLGTLDAAGTDAARTDRAQRLHAEAARRVADLRGDVIALSFVRTTGATALEAADARRAVEADTAQVQSTVAGLTAVAIDDPAVARHITAFAESAEAAVADALRLAADGESPLVRTAFDTAITATLAAGEQLGTRLTERTAATAEVAREARATARQRILLAAGIACLVLLAASHLLSMSIMRVLRRIGEAASAVAGGHLSARARVTSKDEIGRLGASFDEVADSLTTLLIQMESDARRADFGRQLGEAMEMVDTEEDVRGVVARAFALIDAEAPMELLLADSSRAHLERAAVSPTSGAAGCSVVSPYSCVAVRKGVATSFDTSESLNACHKLRDRPGGPCAAVCVPISFMGRSLGVLHATGPAGIPPAAEVQRQLVTLSRHAGMRIGTVRAFARTELQATTDGLTGLLNRRTLENRVRELLQAGERLALVMVDLDRFKQLNDTYGHEAGDRALRLFSQVVRSTMRSEDVVGRLGGEEFVLVLPHSDGADALPALERLRGALADAVTAGGGPAFTASFGVTDTREASEWEELLRIADAGLLRAKAAGRDRIVVGTRTDAAELAARLAA
jgi:diguanylate cyclase (GGDEF)-like protein